jgi:hypothetical protein
MKTIDFVYGGAMVALTIIAVIAFVKAFKSNKKKIDAIKNQMDGRVLGWGDIPEEEVGVLNSERPFIEGYNWLN